MRSLNAVACAPATCLSAVMVAALLAGKGPSVVKLFYGGLTHYGRAVLIQPLPAAVCSLALSYDKRMFKNAGLTAPQAFLDKIVEMDSKMTINDGAGSITAKVLTRSMTAHDHRWWRKAILRQFGITLSTCHDEPQASLHLDAQACALTGHSALAC